MTKGPGPKARISTLLVRVHTYRSNLTHACEQGIVPDHCMSTSLLWLLSKQISFCQTEIIPHADISILHFPLSLCHHLETRSHVHIPVHKVCAQRSEHQRHHVIALQCFVCSKRKRKTRKRNRKKPTSPGFRSKYLFAPDF